VTRALRHTPNGGVVEVNLAHDSDVDNPAVVSSITDEGTGVPEQTLEHIFDPFFRVPSPDAHKQGGSVLGLSISKRIATLYGGSIAAQNLPSSGLPVQIRFPAAKNA